MYPVFWAKSEELATAVSHEVKSNDNSEVEVNSWASRAALDIIGVAGSKGLFPFYPATAKSRYLPTGSHATSGMGHLPGLPPFFVNSFFVDFFSSAVGHHGENRLTPIVGYDFQAIANPNSELLNVYRSLFSPSRFGQLLGVLGAILPQWVIRALP